MFHLFHKYKIVSVSIVDIFKPEFVGGHIDGRFVKHTKIQEVCEKCKKTRVRCIPDIWTLEDLTN